MNYSPKIHSKKSFTEIKPDTLIVLLTFIFPINFLFVKHGVHVSLYGIFLLLIYELIKRSFNIAINKYSKLIFFSLGSIFIATVSQQIITLNLNLAAWDGPSRLLVAGICLLYLEQKNIDYKKILETAIPIALLLLCAYLSANNAYYWENRWANSFVDPNTLGSQSTILSMLCLLSINSSSRIHVNLIKVLGAICGLYISIKAGSKGGWVVIPFMILCWLFIQVNLPTIKTKKFNLIKIASSLILLTLGFTAIGFFIEQVNSRLIQALFEINNWFKDPTIYSSAGARMSMWVVSLQLIQENPLGYGEVAIKEILYNHSLYASIHFHGVKDMILAGPHADILSKGLTLGVLGIIAYLSTILFPAILFISKIQSKNIKIRDAAHMGLMYVTGIFVAGIFNETLSLKYLCSFYGLMIACLASQVLFEKSIHQQSKSTA